MSIEQKLLRKRLNILFLFMSGYILVAYIANIPTFIIEIVKALGFSSDGLPHGVEYFLSFILPQCAYTVLIAVLMIIAAKVCKCSKKLYIKNEDLSVGKTFSILFIFLGFTTVVEKIILYFLSVIKNIGIPVPDISAYFTKPESIFETVLYFITIAIIPGIFEELTFRGILTGAVSGFNPILAVILSSVAFGLVHGNIQQTPFAFMLGLFFGFIYVKYRSLTLTVFLHFLNNFISCCFELIYDRTSDEIYEKVLTATDAAFIILGVIGVLMLIMITRNEKKESNERFFELPPHPVSGENALTAAVTSWGFWLFVAISVFNSIINYISMIIVG